MDIVFMGEKAETVRGYKSDLPEHAGTLEAIAVEFDELENHLANMDAILERS